jgi:pyruvate dehydrogenase E2 component (dihydrolipoamide acetyltransferase)
MAEEFFIPKLGQTVEQVTLVKWLVEDGAKVTQGQEICEVETDKAIFPVESPAKGYIHIGPFTEGQVLPVLTVVAVIGKQEDVFDQVTGGEGDKVTDDTVNGEVTPSPLHPLTPSPSHHPASPRARKLAAEKGVDLSQVTPTGYEGIRIAERDVVAYLAQVEQQTAFAVETPPIGLDKLDRRKATPVAARMAADTGVDLRTVTGSGPGGKIVKDDVTRAIQPLATLQSEINIQQSEILERIPIKGVRAIIAERMAASIHTGARVTLFAEADATELVAARTRLKERVEKDWGFAPSYNDLLVKIVTVALRQFPYMNARINPSTGSGDVIEILRPIHIGQAVDTERGLLVPVIKNADAKGLRQLGEEFRSLAEKARTGRALPDDLTGGTFTITNLGMYEVDYFTPVINLPEAAILGVGRIAPRVVPYNGDAAIRQMTTLSLAFDHRLVDGAPAAKFLQAIKRMVEEPYLLLAG